VTSVWWLRGCTTVGTRLTMRVALGFMPLFGGFSVTSQIQRASS
jgi:hypothetical protein